MRWSCALLVAFALMNAGCSTVPAVLAMSGRDYVPLNTRQEVHDAFGEPTAKGQSESVVFEEFRVLEGCDRVFLGIRGPAFEPLEEFHIQWEDWHSDLLRLMVVSDVSGIPTKGENLIIVAAVNGALHFRLFDDDGKVVVDTDETRLLNQAERLVNLKKQLEGMWPPHMLTEKEKEPIIREVASILGHVQLGSFVIGVVNRKRYGPFQTVVLPSGDPDISGWRRVLPGQTLRFEYDWKGNVTKVSQNGEFLIAPKIQPDLPLRNGVIEFTLGWW